MRKVRKRLLRASLFFAFTSPFGVAAHLASEFGGLGLDRAALLAFSTRHAYLGVIAVASLVWIALTLGSLRVGGVRARARAFSAALPFGGRGRAFAGLSLATQFAFFGVTQVAEGAPLASGNVLAGVLAAALASAVGALLLSVAHRHVVEFVLGVIAVFASTAPTCRRPSQSALERAPRGRSARRSPFAFRYRPPPCAA